MMEDDSLQSKFDAMKESLTELKETFASESKEVEDLLKTLNSNNHDVLTEIMECVAALDALHETNEEDEDEEESLAEALEEDEEKPEASWEEEAEDARKKRDIKRLLGRMFKSIALKTHPDKTKNPSLIDLYMQAQAAYKKEDLEEMYEIHAKVFKLPYKRIPLEQRLAELEVQFNVVFQAFNQHRQSDEFKLYQISKHYGERHADQAHRALLKEILNQRKRDLAYAREF